MSHNDTTAALAVPTDFWEPNAQLREPLDSPISHVALYFVQIVAFLVPPFRGRQQLFVAVLLALVIHSLVHPHFTNNPGLAQPANISWSFYLATIEKLLFAVDGEPEKSFWAVGKNAQKATQLTAFGSSKLRWAVALFLNLRGIRWNFEVKNVPRGSFPVEDDCFEQRAKFIAVKLRDIMYHLLAADLMFQLILRIVWTPQAGVAPGLVNSKYLTLRHSNPLWQLARCFAFCSIPYHMISVQYSLLSALGVLFGLAAPADWPPHFGRLADVTTVRELWGKFWHQWVRRTVTVYSQRAVGMLGVRRGTNASSYLQLWLAFIGSGFFHSVSQPIMPSPTNITKHERCLGIFLFFVCQAAAITMEDFVQFVCRKTRLNGIVSRGASLRTFVGYAWVCSVLWYTLPFAGDAMIRMRFGANAMLPFTFWKPLVESIVPIPPLEFSRS